MSKAAFYGATEKLEDGRSPFSSLSDDDDDNLTTITLRSGDSSPSSSSGKRYQKQSGTPPGGERSSSFRSFGMTGALLLFTGLACVAVLSQTTTVLDSSIASIKTTLVGYGLGAPSSSTSTTSSESSSSTDSEEDSTSSSSSSSNSNSGSSSSSTTTTTSVTKSQPSKSIPSTSSTSAPVKSRSPTSSSTSSSSSSQRSRAPTIPATSASSSSSDSVSSSSSSTASASSSSPKKPVATGISSINGDAGASDIQYEFTRVGYENIALHDTILYYNFLALYDAIIEPYATMQISVTGYDSTTTDVYYQYSVCPDDTSAGAQCQQGALSSIDTVQSMPVTVHCSPFDKYTLTINELSSVTGETLRSTTGSAMCIYVRREIRKLSEVDLGAALEALYTMYSVTTAEGQELYGDQFHSYAYYLNFHHFNSAWQDADHIHEGNGFLLQHIKMTNMVELSMQAVNPVVTLPYWDFTIDSSEGKSSISSAIMTPTIFGTMKQPTDLTWGWTYENDNILDALIADGRWANLKAEMNDKYDDLKAGYGYMRAPWNMNPSPYVSRFAMDLQVGIALPTCSQHYDMLAYSDMMSYLYDIQYGPHATTHSLSGGIYGCDLLKPLWEAGYITDETSLKTICSQWIFYLKEFYRYDYIIPKDNCTVTDDVQSSTCGFTCNHDYATELLFNLKNKISGQVPTGMSDEGWTAWTDFICYGDAGKIFSGDHLESASPADPSFWVIHPTLERLTHAKLMAGGFLDETWATDPVNDQVCDKAECYDSTYGYKDYWDNCCYGHYEFDKVLDFTTGNRSNHYGATNAATLTATDPRKATYSMPYIYDSFSWEHCSDNDFSWMLENLFEQYYNSRKALGEEGEEEDEAEE